MFDPTTVTPINNLVLVKLPIDERNGLIKKYEKNGVTIHLGDPDKHNVGWYASAYGEVVQIPERLNFNEMNVSGDIRSTEWETEIEIEKGDRVYFEYSEVVDALGTAWGGESKAYNIDGEVYFFLRYDRIFLRVREGEIQPVNGWCLGVHDQTIEIDTSLAVPDSVDQTDWTKIRLTHVSARNRAYAGFTQKAIDATPHRRAKAKFDTEEPIEVGFIVFAQKEGFREIENELLTTLPERYVAIQRCRMEAIFEL